VGKVKIALLRDIALFGKYNVNKNPDVYVYFEEVAKLLGKFDYVIGNLETPFTKKIVPWFVNLLILKQITAM